MPLYNSKLRNKKDIITTNDGTKTMYSYEFDECYHSTKDGALQESLNKHIVPAFNLSSKKDKLRVLDICFGLGFNTLATIYYYRKYSPNTKLHIISPEIDKNLVKSLKDFDYPKEFSSLKDIISSISNNFYYEDNNLKIEILIGDAREQIKKIKEPIDIIYQDAFSPKKNPALWSVEWFSDIKAIALKNAILTTYSVATPVRLSLKEAGFRVYNLESKKVRSATIASLKPLLLNEVDLELKLKRNPNAKAIWDKDIL